MTVVRRFPNGITQIHSPRSGTPAGITINSAIPTLFLEQLTQATFRTICLANNCRVHRERITNVSLSVLDVLKNTHGGNQNVSIAVTQSIFTMVEFVEDIPRLSTRGTSRACANISDMRYICVRGKPTNVCARVRAHVCKADLTEERKIQITKEASRGLARTSRIGANRRYFFRQYAAQDLQTVESTTERAHRKKSSRSRGEERKMTRSCVKHW